MYGAALGIGRLGVVSLGQVEEDVSRTDILYNKWSKGYVTGDKIKYTDKTMPRLKEN